MGTVAAMIRPLLSSKGSSGGFLTSRFVRSPVFRGNNGLALLFSPSDVTKNKQHVTTARGVRVFSAASEGRDVEGAKKALLNAQAVCFDVDSTVIQEEGIDILAGFSGAAEAVADLTNRAMGGSMPFQDALKARLDLMKPSRSLVDTCLKEHPPRLSPGIEELVGLLHGRQVAVYLVSGGFRLMIEPVADMLSIPRGNIFANKILFHSGSGEYSGFDADEPTSRDGGKPKVVGMLAKQFEYKRVVMVGDGATDMQAKPPAEAFIGYGGVTVRDAVRKGADWFVTDFTPLIRAIREDGA